MSKIKNNLISNNSIVSGRDTIIENYNVIVNEIGINREKLKTAISKYIDSKQDLGAIFDISNRTKLIDLILEFILINQTQISDDHLICMLLESTEFGTNSVITESTNMKKLEYYKLISEFFEYIRAYLKTLLTVENIILLKKAKVDSNPLKSYHNRLKNFDYDSNCVCSLEKKCSIEDLHNFAMSLIYKEFIDDEIIQSFVRVLLEIVDNAVKYSNSETVHFNVSGNCFEIIHNGDMFNLLEFDGKPTDNGVGSILLKSFINRFEDIVKCSFDYSGSENRYIFDFEDVIFNMRTISTITVDSWTILNSNIPKYEANCNCYTIDMKGFWFLLSESIKQIVTIVSNAPDGSQVTIEFNDKTIKGDLESIFKEGGLITLKKNVKLRYLGDEH